MAMLRQKTIDSFLSPTPLKRKLFLVLFIISFLILLVSSPFSLISSIPFIEYPLQPLFLVLMPLYASLFVPIFMIEAWIYGLFAPADISIPSNEAILQSVITFFLTLLYGYLLICLLSPIIHHIRQGPRRPRVHFLLLVGLLLLSVYLAFYLPLAFFFALPFTIALSGMFCLRLLKKFRSLALSLSLFLILIISGTYLIAYDMLQEWYCYTDFFSQTSEKTETDVIIDSEPTQSGIPTALGNCFQNFQLLPALMEELSKSIRL